MVRTLPEETKEVKDKKVVVMERVIDLALINDKLNYLVEAINKLLPPKKE